MSTLKPIVINQTEQSWEGWDDAEIAAKSAIRWKILISGERGPSAGLVNGIAEFPVGTRLPLHHTNPRRPIMSSAGRATWKSTVTTQTSGQDQPSTFRPTPNTRSDALELNR